MTSPTAERSVRTDLPETSLRSEVLWHHVAETLRPPPLEPFSAWIEREVRLPEGLAAEPGPVTLWPHQRAVADSIGDPTAERVTWLKPVRSGFTFLIACAVARHVRDAPAPVIVLMPTADDARGIMVDDIEESIFASSPSLRGLLPEPSRDAKGRSTLLQRHFPGGTVKVISARAPRNLRRHTAKCVYADEVDAMETYEGDPLQLAERRTTTFRQRKLVAGSSPKLEATSLICRQYEESDKRVFEVRCPQCSGYFELLWKHVQWDEGAPDTARAVCPRHGCVIEEGEQKREAVEAGRWRATRPEVTNHHGYRSNALIGLLPALAWPNLVREWLAAQHDSDRLRVFINTRLAEPWSDDISPELSDAELSARAESFALDDMPREALMLTMGVDVQRDRLECVSCAWNKAGTTYVLAHETLWGPTDENEVWVELDQNLKRRFAHPAGGQLRYDAAGVDCGNDFDRVLAFTGPRLSRKVLALKGASGFGRAALTPSKSKLGHRRFFVAGVDPIKSKILSRLSRPDAFRFSNTLEGIFFEQLVSERRVTRMSRGRLVVRLEQIPGRENHCLDALVYADAAKAALRLDLDQREAELASPTPPKPAPQVWRSQFFDGLA
jgi:phage terminase large subunit GpA-like protein